MSKELGDIFCDNNFAKNSFREKYQNLKKVEKSSIRITLKEKYNGHKKGLIILELEDWGKIFA